MKAMTTGWPATVDTLAFAERADPGDPGRGEIRVALHGSSLNFHDLGVVTGRK
jgi:NADPH:quinone reductase-like Zn-dependent oxidoreductase